MVEISADTLASMMEDEAFERAAASQEGYYNGYEDGYQAGYEQGYREGALKYL